MVTTETELTVDTDQHVLEARKRLAEAQETLDLAIARRHELPRSSGGLAILSLEALTADDAIRRAEAARDQSRHVAEVAESMARTRIANARRPGRLELLRYLRTAYVAAHEAAVALREYDAATGSMVGYAAGEHPTPRLLAEDDIKRLDRLIAPPTEEPVAAPPKGSTRVRLLGPVYDHYGIRYVFPGDVADFRDEDARDLIKRELAVEVA